MLKFSEWIKIKEVASQGILGSTQNILGAIGNDNDPSISKMVAAAVDNKDPKNIKAAGDQAANKLRINGKKSALKGQYADALKKAAEAEKINNITANIK
jgi:hypothetical protein